MNTYIATGQQTGGFSYEGKGKMKDVDVERLAEALMAKGLHDYAGRAAELAKRANEARRMNADADHPAQVEDFYDRGKDGYLSEVAQCAAYIRWIERTIATMPAQPPEGRDLDPLTTAIDHMFDLSSDISAEQRLDLIAAIRASGVIVRDALNDARFKLIRPEKATERGRRKEDDPDLRLLIGVAYRLIYPEGQQVASGDRRKLDTIIKMTLALCDTLDLKYDDGRVKQRLNEMYETIGSNLKGNKDTRALKLSDVNPAIFDPDEIPIQGDNN